MRRLRDSLSYVAKVTHSLFLILADGLILIFPHGRYSRTKKKVLLIRLDSIGDFILWLDAAKDIKRLYPDNGYEITLLGNIVWTSLAESLPYFDEVWHLDRRRFIRSLPYRLSALKKVRSAGFDVVVSPSFSREFLHEDALVRISGAEERIGPLGDYSSMAPRQSRISDRWYTRLLRLPEAPTMELLRNAEFMRSSGLKDFRAGVPELPLRTELPADFDVRNYFVLFPGAQAYFRQWPLTNFRKLAERICEATGWTGVICGGTSEKALGEALKRDTPVPLRNWCGRTSLTELIAIIAGARMLIGNETGAVHIAASLSVPSVCILGGGHYGRFIPYKVEIATGRPLPVAVYSQMNCFNCNWQCLHEGDNRGAMQCVEGITVDAVWKAVRDILKRLNVP